MQPSKTLQNKINAAPSKPGVYQYFDESGNLLYVGKAKNIKNRVRSYFNSERSLNGKTRVLVKKIRSIKYILTESEMDALLLENSLIKKHQPRYNVMLKDDKTYPWICIKKEEFPRVFSTRKMIKDGSEYFGPYASVKNMNLILDLVRKNYKLRTCNYVLSKENIEKEKFKACLELHIGNCKAPCEGRQLKKDYEEGIQEIRELLKGNVNGLRNELKKAMKLAAAELNFELAEELKQKWEAFTRFQSKSTVVNPSIHDTDVFSLISDGDLVYINYMKINNGAIIQGHTLEMKRRIEEEESDLLAMAIAELRDRFNSQSKNLLVSLSPNMDFEGLDVHIPQRGDKKKLIELSLRNAKYFMMDRRKQIQKTDPERHTKRILQGLKEDLRLQNLPVHIECFDNSNIQGSNPVAACVVFKNAKPSKKDYRHFNIKTVEGPDDFASMEEVVYRRYKSLITNGEDLPQLIVIDGGKGQLNAALKSLDLLGLRGKIAIIGIAKRLEEIFYPGDKYPLYLDKTSESLKVIQHLRNEAHRFGITHHRNKRSKNSLQSELDEIDGIGPQSIQALLRKFGSLSRIKEANKQDLEAIVGASKAQKIVQYFEKLK